MEAEPQTVPAPDLPEPVSLAWPTDPEAVVSLMVSEAEMLRISGATACAAMPPITNEHYLRDLSPLGRRGL